MPRPPRFILPGYPQHVIVRGNNRQAVFADDSDYLSFLGWLQQAADRHRCAIHAYVLMTNHIHLLVTPTFADGLGKMVQMVGRHYVQYFNRRYRRTGTLWEGRYKASLVDSERYLLTCYRYVELNPVRANIVQCPSKYAWSSYRSNALGESSDLITRHELFDSLGDSASDRQAVYRELFATGIPEEDLVKIRDAANKGWALGSEGFVQRVERLTQRPACRQPRGGDRKSEAFRRLQGIKRN